MRNLGSMRHRLAVKAIVRVPDGAGGFARSDTGQALIPARVKTLSVAEVNAYQQRQQRATHKAHVRWRADLAQGQTVIWKRPTAHGGDLPLYVVSVSDANPDKRPGEFMELVLREGGNL